jgi:hypothetical protein
MSLLLALFPYPYFRDGRFAPEPAEEATRRFDHFHMMQLGHVCVFNA